MLDVCLLGSGGMMPLPDRPLSATAFRVGAETVLFDCGEGTQVNWRVSGFSFPATGTIILSHLHADHVAGLPGILFQISFSGRTEPVTIYGPQWTAEIVSNLVSIVGKLPFELRVAELEGGETFKIGNDMSVSTLLLEHRMPSIGYVIDVPRRPRFDPEKARALDVPMTAWKALQRGETVDGVQPETVSGPPRKGIRLGLITDTRYLDSIAPFVSGSDLLVCEAMFGADEDEGRARERGHMTFRQAATIARDAGVGALWLTHFSPRVDDPETYLPQVESIFPDTEVGRSGLRRTISFPNE